MTSQRADSFLSGVFKVNSTLSEHGWCFFRRSCVALVCCAVTAAVIETNSLKRSSLTLHRNCSHSEAGQTEVGALSCRHIHEQLSLKSLFGFFVSCFILLKKAKVSEASALWSYQSADVTESTLSCLPCHHTSAVHNTAKATLPKLTKFQEKSRSMCSLVVSVMILRADLCS